MLKYCVSTVVKSTSCDYPFYQRYKPFSMPVFRGIENGGDIKVAVLRIKPERTAPIFNRYEWYIVFKYFVYVYDRLNDYVVRDAFLIDEAYLIIQDRTGVSQPKKISIKHDEHYIVIPKWSVKNFVDAVYRSMKEPCFKLALAFSGYNSYLALYVSFGYCHIKKSSLSTGSFGQEIYIAFDNCYIWHFDNIVYSDKILHDSGSYTFTLDKDFVKSVVTKLSNSMVRVASASEMRPLVLKSGSDTLHHVIAIDKVCVAFGIELSPTNIEDNFMPLELMSGRALPDYSTSAIDKSTSDKLFRSLSILRKKRSNNSNYNIIIETNNDKIYAIEYSKLIGIMKLYQWTGERFIEVQDLTWAIKSEIKGKRIYDYIPYHYYHYRYIDIKGFDILNDRYICLHSNHFGYWLLELSDKPGEIRHAAHPANYIKLHDGTLFFFENLMNKVHVVGQFGRVIIDVEPDYSLIYGFYNPVTQKVAIIGKAGQNLLAYRRYNVQNNSASIEEQIHLEIGDNSLYYINSRDSTLVICPDKGQNHSVFFVFDINGLSYQFKTKKIVSDIHNTNAGRYIIANLRVEDVINDKRSKEYQLLYIYKVSNRYQHIMLPHTYDWHSRYDTLRLGIDFKEAIYMHFDVGEGIMIKMYRHVDIFTEYFIMTDNYFMFFDHRPIEKYPIEYLPFCYNPPGHQFDKKDKTTYRMLVNVNNDSEQQYIIFDKLKQEDAHAYYSLYLKSVIINKNFSKVFLATPYNRYYTV